jgi:hypothetical protein
MGKNIRDNGKKDLKTVTGNYIFKMEVILRVSFIKIRYTVQVPTVGKM